MFTIILHTRVVCIRRTDMETAVVVVETTEQHNTTGPVTSTHMGRVPVRQLFPGVELGVYTLVENECEGTVEKREKDGIEHERWSCMRVREVEVDLSS